VSELEAASQIQTKLGQRAANDSASGHKGKYSSRSSSRLPSMPSHTAFKTFRNPCQDAVAAFRGANSTIATVDVNVNVEHKECSHRASGPAEEGWLASSLDARMARCEGKYHASGNVWRNRTLKWEICPRDEFGQSRSTAKLCLDLPERPAAQRSLWTGSAAVTQLARRWLRDCLNGHQTCLRESRDRSDVSRAQRSVSSSHGMRKGQEARCI
jgi:hypothetical protein